ncbi:MAG TPA: helix-turn-helix transcriptional regulator [Pyrinomonadaceae bacterium]
MAEKLTHIRRALGLSQDAMLARLGLSGQEGLFRSSVSGYELGKREPPLPVLLEYARAANVSVEALIDDGLDLPDNLPPARKSEGIRRISSPSVKRHTGRSK